MLWHYQFSYFYCWILLIMWIYHILFHSSVDEHLGCFHFWTITNNASILDLICALEVKIEPINLDYINLSHSPVTKHLPPVFQAPLNLGLKDRIKMLCKLLCYRNNWCPLGAWWCLKFRSGCFSVRIMKIYLPWVSIYLR